MRIDTREFSAEQPITTLFIALTADEVALMPKSYRASRTMEIELASTGVTGERNETGVRRAVAIIKKIRAAGGEISTTESIRNGASLDSILAYLGV